MSKSRTKRILSGTDPFELIPVTLYPYETLETGNIALHVPKFKNEKFGKLFLLGKAKPYHIIELDILGTRVYRHINGTNNLFVIFQLVSEDGHEPIEQLKERGLEFIQQLFNHKYITFKQLQEEAKIQEEKQ